LQKSVSHFFEPEKAGTKINKQPFTGAGVQVHLKSDPLIFEFCDQQRQ